MKRILITGANSYVGVNVENWLMKTPDMFQVDTVATKNSEWKQVAFSNYDVVFHVAGIAHVDAKKSMESLYRKVNTDLTIEVAKCAKKNGVKQFIFMSSMIVYHESNSLKPTIIVPGTKPNPNTFYGDSKLQAEIGLARMESNDFKIVILRAPMIYGPGCKGNFSRLTKLASITPIFPAFHNKRSMIFIENLCEFIRQIILRGLSGTFHPDNMELADTVEIVKAIARINSHKMFVWKWLNIFVYLGSPFIKAINKMFSDNYFSDDLKKVSFIYQLVSLEESFKYFNLSDISKG